MGLSPGTRLGSYEIQASIGAGGMGEVYRARDTRLNRDVALKVLPDLFARDPERLARFQREAQILASLNHPNIAAIHGLEEAEGLKALVLELVDGRTLADRIADGPIPLDEALPIARQIAEGLEAAHEHGVIHRDLKPANVKLRADGTVKVLDFGLAKAFEREAGADPSTSPTLTAAATRIGVILGTAAYMSPEQARGKPADRRADIWAFGCLLYEMLTGRRAFEGGEVSEVLAKVLEREPDWTALPANAPRALRRLLRRCLQKDRKLRLHDIADARLELEDAPDEWATDALAAAPTPRPGLSHRPVPLVAAIGLVVVTAVGVWAVFPRSSPPTRALARFVLTLPTGDQFTNAGRHAVAIAPDGTVLAYAANNQLYLRPLDRLAPSAIRGTEGGGRSPFFSPDGQWVGFWHSGSLKKVAVSGGAAVTLCEAGNPFGATWGQDETIVYGQGAEGIWRVPAAGGKPERLISVESGRLAHGPQLLPGDAWVLFTLSSGFAWNEAQIVAQSLETGERKVLVQGGTDGRYLPSGHLLYAHEGTVLAVPFDVARVEIRGGPVPVLEDVLQTRIGQTGAAHFSVSGDGTLVYIPGGAATRRQLVWVDRSGREELLPLEPHAYRSPRVSPDGTRLAVEVEDEGNVNIVVYDLDQQTSMRLTFDPGADRSPLWSPDGRWVVFAADRKDAGLFRKASDGTGQEERLIPAAGLAVAGSWLPDGKALLFSQPDPRTSRDLDLWALALDTRHTARPLLVGPGNQGNPAISPNGRWLAYNSTESGVFQVYVRPFPNVESGRWLITPRGGVDPIWSPDGRELFYRTDRALMVVPVDTSGRTFRYRNPQLLFEGSYLQEQGRHYDVSPDGRRFVLIKEAAGDALAPQGMIVVLNWFEQLKRRVPTP